MTSIEQIVFNPNGNDLRVTAIDSHQFIAEKLDFQDNGVALEYTENSNHIRVFLPWNFLMSVEQDI